MGSIFSPKIVMPVSQFNSVCHAGFLRSRNTGISKFVLFMRFPKGINRSLSCDKTGMTHSFLFTSIHKKHSFVMPVFCGCRNTGISQLFCFISNSICYYFLVTLITGFCWTNILSIAFISVSSFVTETNFHL